jgi:N6-L-threonylcarbamoyladenine synthase
MGSGLILGIESSCDETAAAVVERGSRTLSSVVASQIATHARYGGVVPELASREHLRAVVPVVRAALEQAGIAFDDLDAIAVTSGPGLAGALLVGITYAKALAFARKLPLIAVNHIEGHIHAVLLHERESLPIPQECHPERSEGSAFRPSTEEPIPVEESALALVVSGGHTHLYLARPIQNAWSYRLIGRTLDDAAGEAYDKVSKLLGFGYPGGPWIDALARFGDPLAVPFAFSQIKTKIHLQGKTPRTKAAKTSPIADLDPHLLFSFSGIKTAVLRYVELHNLRLDAQARAARLFAPQDGHPERSAAESKDLLLVASPPKTKEEALALCSQQVLDLVASFQHAVVGDLLKKTFAAAEAHGARRILVTGGVAANRELRARFSAEATRRNQTTRHPERSAAQSKDLLFECSFPTPALSTDNAAMIAAAAWPRFLSGEFAESSLSGDPALALGR